MSELIVDIKELLKGAIFEQCSDCEEGNKDISEDYSKPRYVECSNCDGTGQTLTDFGKEIVQLIREVDQGKR